MNLQARNTYLNMQVNTAHPGELTLMLFNGCIKFMKQALEAMDKKEMESKTQYIRRTIDILDELIATLNMKYEVSTGLRLQYEFMKEKLLEAGFKMNKQAIYDCLDLMTDLRDTWSEALRSVKPKVNA